MGGRNCADAALPARLRPLTPPSRGGPMRGAQPWARRSCRTLDLMGLLRHAFIVGLWLLAMYALWSFIGAFFAPDATARRNQPTRGDHERMPAALHLPELCQGHRGA
jgi:hypothetical protein